MPDPNLFRLRVEYAKTGRLALLSHLEVARALERAVRRADLPFAVSQGFSPHMKIAFGAALPVGVGSTCEIFDLQMTRYVAPERALAALQQASAPDLAPHACRYIGPHDPAASVALPYSTYEARLSHPLEAPLAVPDEVRVVRKKKEKVLRVADYLVGEVRADGDAVRFELEAKPTGSLRPDVLMRSCLQATFGGVGLADGAGAEAGALAEMAAGAGVAPETGAGAGAGAGVAAGAGAAAGTETGAAVNAAPRIVSLTRVAQRA